MGSNLPSPCCPGARMKRDLIPAKTPTTVEVLQTRLKIAQRSHLKNICKSLSSRTGAKRLWQESWTYILRTKKQQLSLALALVRSIYLPAIVQPGTGSSSN